MQRIFARVVVLLAAIVILAVLAGLGAFFFFVLLGIVVIISLFQALRSKGTFGSSRDTAFSFSREDFEVHTNPPPIIETEYHEVRDPKEKKDGSSGAEG